MKREENIKIPQACQRATHLPDYIIPARLVSTGWQVLQRRQVLRRCRVVVKTKYSFLYTNVFLQPPAGATGKDP